MGYHKAFGVYLFGYWKIKPCLSFFLPKLLNEDVLLSLIFVSMKNESAKFLICSWIANSLDKLYNGLSNKKSMKEDKIDTAASSTIKKLMHNHFEGLNGLGITVPGSYAAN